MEITFSSSQVVKSGEVLCTIKNLKKDRRLSSLPWRRWDCLHSPPWQLTEGRVFLRQTPCPECRGYRCPAAALAKLRTPNYPPNAPNAPDLAAIAAGEDRAESNGYVTDADSNVQVHICNETGLVPPCEGLPVTADLSEYIQVVIRLTTKTTFARIVGMQKCLEYRYCSGPGQARRFLHLLSRIWLGCDEFA